jgi:hypothetical protein
MRDNFITYQPTQEYKRSTQDDKTIDKQTPLYWNRYKWAKSSFPINPKSCGVIIIPLPIFKLAIFGVTKWRFSEHVSNRGRFPSISWTFRSSGMRWDHILRYYGSSPVAVLHHPLSHNRSGRTFVSATRQSTASGSLTRQCQLITGVSITVSAYQPITAYQPISLSAYQPISLSAYQPITGVSLSQVSAYQPITAYQPISLSAYQPITGVSLSQVSAYHRRTNRAKRIGSRIDEEYIQLCPCTHPLRATLWDP